MRTLKTSILSPLPWQSGFGRSWSAKALSNRNCQHNSCAHQMGLMHWLLAGLASMLRCREQWERVGEVVGGPAQSDTVDVPSKWHNGEQYDFVVDVDFEDGVPPKKLAFNRSDNPYNVAER